MGLFRWWRNCRSIRNNLPSPKPRVVAWMHGGNPPAVGYAWEWRKRTPTHWDSSVLIFLLPPPVANSVFLLVFILSWLSFASTHRLFSWSQSWLSSGGDVNVFVHLITCSMLCSTRVLDMITHTFGWGGGGVNVFHATLHMSSLDGCTYRQHHSCYAPHIFFTWLYIPLNSFVLPLNMSSTCFLARVCQRSEKTKRS